MRIVVLPMIPSERTPEQALCVDAALVLFNPDRRFELIGFLDKERSRARMQTNLILNKNFFDEHKTFSHISEY